MTALQDPLISILLDGNAHPASRLSRYPSSPRVQKNVDALVLKQDSKSFAHVGIFLGHQPLVAIDHGHFAAESAHRLSQFYSDIAAADHKQMLGNLIKFERLDMRERLRLKKTRNCFHRRPCTGADDHICATQSPGGPIGQSDLNRWVHPATAWRKCDHQHRYTG